MEYCVCFSDSIPSHYDLCGWTSDLIYKSHIAPFSYLTKHHLEQKFAWFCPKWCILSYGINSLWDLWAWSIWMTYIHNTVLWGKLTTKIVNIGSGFGLLPAVTKPAPMLTYQFCPGLRHSPDGNIYWENLSVNFKWISFGNYIFANSLT